MTYALWIVQVLLALVFLFTGGMKLTMSDAALTEQMPLPALFIRFISVCEVLGAFGLVLPGMFRIRTELTPLAAAGLTIIMIGATVLTIMMMGPLMAIVPAVIGLLSAFVAYGRWKVVPQGQATRERELVANS